MNPVEGLEQELILLGQAFLSGAGLSLVYDMIRVIRRIVPHGIILVSIEDLVYWVAAGGWLFLKACQVNNGIIRGYMLLGIGAGALVYGILFGRWFMRIATKWILAAKKRLKRVTKAVTIELKKLHRNQETEE